LGPLKDAMLDFLVFNRRMKHSMRQRAVYRSRLADLAPLPEPTDCQCEVHMLCGKRDLDMGIWASWSLMRFFAGRSRLFVHSDGSLCDDDMQQWKSIVRGTVLITTQEADQAADNALGRQCPTLLAWRSRNFRRTNTAQVVDFHLFGNSKRILLMDSDVLCFKDPVEVKLAMENAHLCYRWCQDLLSAYGAPLEVLESVAGAAVPGKLCNGFLLAPRFSLADFIRLESLVATIHTRNLMDFDHYWCTQAYYALMAPTFADCKPFSEPYSNRLGNAPNEVVLRHYVGIKRVRYRYFTEGLPRLLASVPSSSKMQE
jgi:hypothetical protein